jgi:hypothetical protein
MGTHRFQVRRKCECCLNEPAESELAAEALSPGLELRGKQSHDFDYTLSAGECKGNRCHQGAVYRLSA